MQLMFFAKSNDTSFVYIKHKSQAAAVIEEKSNANRIKLSNNSNIIKIAKVYEKLRANMGCEANEDTLDMDIIINPYIKSSTVRQIGQYGENFIPDSLMKFGSMIAKEQSVKNIVKVIYLPMCSQFESESNVKIAKELLEIDQNDSAILFVPEHPCLHVNNEIIVKDNKWKYCTDFVKFENVPIHSRHKIELKNFSSRKMNEIIDSIGFKRKVLSTCSELRGIIAGYNGNDIKIFEFDACNGDVSYKDKNMKSWTNIKNGSYDEILKMFQINDHYFDESDDEN